jgi:hypothetical protein
MMRTSHAAHAEVPHVGVIRSLLRLPDLPARPKQRCASSRRPPSRGVSTLDERWQPVRWAPPFPAAADGRGVDALSSPGLACFSWTGRGRCPLPEVVRPAAHAGLRMIPQPPSLPSLPCLPACSKGRQRPSRHSLRSCRLRRTPRASALKLAIIVARDKTFLSHQRPGSRTLGIERHSRNPLPQPCSEPAQRVRPVALAIWRTELPASLVFPRCPVPRRAGIKYWSRVPRHARPASAGPGGRPKSQEGRRGIVLCKSDAAVRTVHHHQRPCIVHACLFNSFPEHRTTSIPGYIHRQRQPRLFRQPRAKSTSTP